ncbi:glycosyltransferase family 2 protein [Selenomonas sputigena]|uniref:glycosyltransferase family 2 protein n=1 Tax=Selenomonas sputigena TaxID=69823 RepID=UPI0022308F59|nr:glycosyltransferase family 2 protein [Selenomonas sputigena]UZD42477.1 glycosyltransferase family 2 protein [Selenomonas sputigena]
MNIVITMGGLGSRFKKAGYNVPKYAIEAKGKTLFAWSMLSLKSFWDYSFIFLVRKEDEATPFIQKECKMLGIQSTIIEIEKLTRGQAETAMLAESVWDENAPLLIYNIDTYVKPGCMTPGVFHGDGFIPCFNAEGTHWSFVRLDAATGKATEVREKKRISDNCTIGAYYFLSAALYREVYQNVYEREGSLEDGERYVAPMYNYMVEHGKNVYIQNISSECVHVLGTPEELQDFLDLDSNFVDE